MYIKIYMMYLGHRLYSEVHNRTAAVTIICTTHPGKVSVNTYIHTHIYHEMK